MDINESYGFLLAKVEEEMETLFIHELEKLNISARQFGVLQFIEKNPYSSQIMVSNALLVDRTTMVSHVDFLEDNDLLLRVKNPNDRRSFVLKVTNNGKEVLEKGRRYLRETENEVLKELNTNERETLKNLLSKVWYSIQKEDEK